MCTALFKGLCLLKDANGRTISLRKTQSISLVMIGNTQKVFIP